MPQVFRRRIVIAVAVWASLSALLSVPAILRGAMVPAFFFAGVALAPVLIAGLVRSRRLAALLLVLPAVPFAVQYLRAVILARGAGAAAVADSPTGFLVGRFTEVLFFVPLLAFAYAVWRRRDE